MNNGNEILEMFLYETGNLLEQLDGILLAAEHTDTFSPDEVNGIFRIMHTIKGSSAMMEFTPLTTIAHRIEDLFFIIRENSMSAVPERDRPDLFDLLFQSIDYFRSELEKLQNEEPFSEDIDSFLQKINTLIAKIQQDHEQETNNLSFASAESATSGAPAQNEFAYVIHVFFDEGCGMENLRAFMLVNSIREFCGSEDFTFEPSDVETDAGTAQQIIQNGFILRFRSVADRDEAVGVVTASGSLKNYRIENEHAQPDTVPAPPEKSASAEVLKTAPTPQTSAAPVPAAPSGNHMRTKESLISVNLSKLDELMSVVGEIVITESMVTASPDLRGQKLDNFTKSARQLRKLTDKLQDVSMSLRMIPVSGTFQKMNRIVRDMSKKLGRPAHLTLLGEDTEVDKTIVDGIGDPIMHIVRNSMDHGIEKTVQERIDAGKNPEGEIVLSARHTGSEVIIAISDDGCGVDCDAVLEKAQRVGLANPEAQYSQKEILNFLMMPGFSTNTEVTEFSGRGVGMDVVKKNVEEIGGTVSISSTRGKGMVTTLKIPLTMAIMDGMEVAVGNSVFTIPINNIRQIFKVTAQDVVYDAAHKEMIRMMENFYPIIRIRDIYSLPAGCEQIEDGILLWVEAGESAFCLFVDKLIGEQQIVVKPLPCFLNRYNIKNSGISGCTILGDGSISVILDAASLYTAAQTL